MKLYIIRHGESEANVGGYAAGWAPVSLTEKGFSDAKNIRRYLEKIPFDKVYTSDLLRAKQTAQTALPEYEQEETKLLREINVGTTSGKSIAEKVQEYGESYTKNRAAWNFVSYGGEDTDMASARAEQFLKLVEKSGYACVAAFSHEAYTKVLLDFVLGVKLPHRGMLCSNCTVMIFEYTDGRWRLNSWMNPEDIFPEDR